MQGEKRDIIISDFLLLLVAAIWGFGFVAQRVGMESLGPYTYNGIRFLLGALCLIPLSRKSAVLSLASWNQAIQPHQRIRPLAAGLIAGVILFGGATLQQLGLQYTTAGKAGFITGLYVVLVPILGLFLGQRTNRGTWIGAVSAAVGLYFLSVPESLEINPGDILVTAGALFWAAHVLALSWLSPRTNAIRLAMIQFAVCGFLSLCIGLVIEETTMGAIRQAAIPILYGGVCSVGVGYTLQVVVQQKAHPAHAAIILSLETVFGALGGWLLLDEYLSWRALFGCGFMLCGMLVSQLWPSPAGKKVQTK
ncbi:DMT family transporter [Desulfolithobacter sp.]